MFNSKYISQEKKNLYKKLEEIINNSKNNINSKIEDTET
jgi:hypothetical protein